MINAEGKMVISYSALAAFKTCPKSYEIEYEWMRESKHDNEAVKKGSLFHRYMEEASVNHRFDIFPEDEGAKMYHIARDYLENRGLPTDIVAAEESLYWEVIPGVIFRVTPDLLYFKDGTVICRDWKTFGKKPSIDIHISDQARFYIIALEALYNKSVEFEFVYVRSERIGVPRPRSAAWTMQDSYFTIPYSLSLLQKERTKQDLVESIKALLDARRLNQYYRTGRTGWGIGACTGCFQRPLCAEEWEHGFVSPEKLEALSTQRENLMKVDDDLLQ
jgi:PD-(D/E)XK nuclease superfamily protein